MIIIPFQTFHWITKYIISTKKLTILLKNREIEKSILLNKFIHHNVLFGALVKTVLLTMQVKNMSARHIINPFFFPLITQNISGAWNNIKTSTYPSIILIISLICQTMIRNTKIFLSTLPQSDASCSIHCQVINTCHVQ